MRSVIEAGWCLDGVEAETDVDGSVGHLRIGPQFTAQTPPPADYVHCTLPMYAAQPRASAEVGMTALSIVEQAYRSSAGT